MKRSDMQDQPETPEQVGRPGVPQCRRPRHVCEDAAAARGREVPCARRDSFAELLLEDVDEGAPKQCGVLVEVRHTKRNAAVVWQTEVKKVMGGIGKEAGACSP